MENGKDLNGLDENIAGLLCYVLGWISGLAIFLLETENKSVRFHAMQSIIVFGILTILGLALGWVPVLGWIIWILSVILWIVLMVKAYQGTKFKLPISGKAAEKWAG